MVVTDFGATDAVAALAVQPDGKLVAAGRTGSDVAIARYGTATTPTSSTSTSSTSTSTSTSTSSTLPTTTTPTTVGSPFTGICTFLAQLRAQFASSTLLAPFVTVIDVVRSLVGCP
jgi:hypothetical protein